MQVKATPSFGCLKICCGTKLLNKHLQFNIRKDRGFYISMPVVLIMNHDLIEVGLMLRTDALDFTMGI